MPLVARGDHPLCSYYNTNAASGIPGNARGCISGVMKYTMDIDRAYEETSYAIRKKLEIQLEDSGGRGR